MSAYKGSARSHYKVEIYHVCIRSVISLCEAMECTFENVLFLFRPPSSPIFILFNPPLTHFLLIFSSLICLRFMEARRATGRYNTRVHCIIWIVDSRKLLIPPDRSGVVVFRFVFQWTRQRVLNPKLCSSSSFHILTLKFNQTWTDEVGMDLRFHKDRIRADEIWLWIQPFATVFFFIPLCANKNFVWNGKANEFGIEMGYFSSRRMARARYFIGPKSLST